MLNTVSEQASLDLIDPRKLVTPRRYDLAVKWRFFRNYLGFKIDVRATDVYRRHIKARQRTNALLGLGMDGKLSVDDYIDAAEELAVSMETRGFRDRHAIPIDPDGELLGGAHRTACAIALQLDSVPVDRLPQKAWAPAWDLQWFVDNGTAEADLDRLKADFEEMQQ